MGNIKCFTSKDFENSIVYWKDLAEMLKDYVKEQSARIADLEANTIVECAFDHHGCCKIVEASKARIAEIEAKVARYEGALNKIEGPCEHGWGTRSKCSPQCNGCIAREALARGTGKDKKGNA